MPAPVAVIAVTNENIKDFSLLQKIEEKILYASHTDASESGITYGKR